MYAYTYVHIYVRMYISMCAFMYAYMYICMGCTCVYAMYTPCLYLVSNTQNSKANHDHNYSTLPPNKPSPAQAPPTPNRRP